MRPPGALVSTTVYRIGSDTPSYTAEDRSGAGAEKNPGRWNTKGAPVIYAASSRALACLETLVQSAPGGAYPFNRDLVEYTIPAPAWEARITFDREDAGLIGWDAVPAGMVSKRWGTTWLASGDSLIAEIPSVLVVEETNVLINPKHPDSPSITARTSRKWIYDPHFWATGSSGSGLP